MVALLIETCKLHDVNPEAWLTDMLTRGWANRRLAEFTPGPGKPPRTRPTVPARGSTRLRPRFEPKPSGKRKTGAPGSFAYCGPVRLCAPIRACRAAFLGHKNDHVRSFLYCTTPRELVVTAYGAIEAGGTKFICAVGTGPDDMRAIVRIPTAGPQDTLSRIRGFFTDYQELHGDLAAIGIGSFGPVDNDPASPTFGFIKRTAKNGWAHFDFLGAMKMTFNLPVAFDSDVNVAVLGEYLFGAGQGFTNIVYLTVGTGIGGGAILNGSIVRGALHPEMGHMRIPHFATDPFTGSCIFHGDCLEGLASGIALKARWGLPPEDLATDHPAWALEAQYLSLAIVNVICVLSPQKIIVGGGVMQQSHLLPMIRANVLKTLGGYLDVLGSETALLKCIGAPALAHSSGIMGAIAMARSEVEREA